MLHAIASTWSLCVRLPVQRMLLGISAAINFTIYDGGDVLGAYAHASSGDIPIYLTVDTSLQLRQELARVGMGAYNKKITLRILPCR